jgi:drug/metabolite transporter (DMT)-like permease
MDRREAWGALAARPGAAGALGAMAIAFSGILVRLADVSPSTAAVFRCLYALPPLAVLAWWERQRFGPRPIRQRQLAWIAGVFFALDLVFWHNSIAYVGAGLATVLGNMQVVLVAFLAWVFLREPVGWRLVAAIAVVVAGVVLISGVLEEGAFGSNPALGVLFGALTSLAYAGFILVLRQGNRDIRRPAGPLFDATAVATLASAAAGLILGELDLAPGWDETGWLVLLALTAQVAGWLLISVSLPRLPAALTSVILMIQPVASVALSMAILGEEPSGLQLAGVGLVLAGVLIATAGRRPTREPAPAPQAATLEQPAS